MTDNNMYRTFLAILITAGIMALVTLVLAFIVMTREMQAFNRIIAPTPSATPELANDPRF